MSDFVLRDAASVYAEGVRDGLRKAVSLKEHQLFSELAEANKRLREAQERELSSGEGIA